MRTHLSDRLPCQVQRMVRYAVQTMLDEDARAINNKHADRAIDRALEDFAPIFLQLWHGGATPPYRLIAPLTETEKTRSSTPSITKVWSHC